MDNLFPLRALGVGYFSRTFAELDFFANPAIPHICFCPGTKIASGDLSAIVLLNDTFPLRALGVGYFSH